MRRRIIAEVDLKKMLGNYRRIARHVNGAKMISVIKADAYGMGAKAYAEVLAQTDTLAFGVADGYEALELLPYGKPVQILSSVLPDEIPEMVRHGVILPAIDLATAKLISAAAVKLGVTAKVHIKLDSGMGRLGITWQEAPKTIRAIARLPNLACEGILSHCAMQADPHCDYTDLQLDRFTALLADLAKGGIRFKHIHTGASGAIRNFPRTFAKPFNAVRPGLILHGSFDLGSKAPFKLENVLTLKARIAQVRKLEAGTTLGYGRTWCLSAPAKIATVAMGYSDGLPRQLSNTGRVIVNGKSCPVVGRVSMDYTLADVTRAGAVEAGDDAVLLGGGAPDEVVPNDWGVIKGTIANDILCAIGHRVERVYV